MMESILHSLGLKNLFQTDAETDKGKTSKRIVKRIYHKQNLRKVVNIKIPSIHNMDRRSEDSGANGAVGDPAFVVLFKQDSHSANGVPTSQAPQCLTRKQKKILFKKKLKNQIFTQNQQFQSTVLLPPPPSAPLQPPPMSSFLKDDLFTPINEFSKKIEVIIPTEENKNSNKIINSNKSTISKSSSTSLPSSTTTTSSSSKSLPSSSSSLTSSSSLPSSSLSNKKQDCKQEKDMKGFQYLKSERNESFLSKRNNTINQRYYQNYHDNLQQKKKQENYSTHGNGLYNALTSPQKPQSNQISTMHIPSYQKNDNFETIGHEEQFLMTSGSQYPTILTTHYTPKILNQHPINHSNEYGHAFKSPAFLKLSDIQKQELYNEKKRILMRKKKQLKRSVLDEERSSFYKNKKKLQSYMDMNGENDPFQTLLSAKKEMVSSQWNKSPSSHLKPTILPFQDDSNAIEISDDEEDNGEQYGQMVNRDSENADNEVYANQEEAEDILSRNFNSVLQLREQSQIFQLSNKVIPGTLEEEIFNEIMNEFLDDFTKQICTFELKKTGSKEIFKKLVSELVMEIIEEQKEFIPLSTSDKQIVHRVFDEYANEYEVIVSGFNVDMTREKMLCMKDLTWLNDEVINFYMNLLSERCKANSDRYPRCHFHTTFFYPKLIQGGRYNYSNVRRWTRKIDIFTFDKVIIPIHLGAHWTLSVINLRDKRFEYYDSLGSTSTGRNILKLMSNYIQDESMDKKKTKLDVSSWDIFIPTDIPQQHNSWDCGVFTCKFANCISKDCDFDFSQRNMSYFRQRMVIEIISKKVL